MNEYQLLNKKSNLNIFHSNIYGLASKLDNLQEFLAGSTTKLDIVTITETSEKEDIGFRNNVEIEVYEIYHTASKSSKGGTAIYVNKNFDTIALSELNVHNVEYESTWIEIKNKYSKNIVCGTIYGHPHYNFDEFFKYLESCLSTLYIHVAISSLIYHKLTTTLLNIFLTCSVVMVCYPIYCIQLE